MESRQPTQSNIRLVFGRKPAGYMEDNESFFSFQSESTGEVGLSGKSDIFQSDFFVDQSSATSEKSPSGSSESCVYECWFNDEIHEAVSLPLGERESQSDSVSQTWNEGTSCRGTPKIKEEESKEVVIIREGTNLMKSIGFPTVLVDVRSRKLHRSTLYYVVLELESRDSSGEIACMMLTSPITESRNILTAELLPLKNDGSEPLLLSTCYSCIFSKGCTFKIKALKQGRRIDQKARKWEHYDRSKRKIQDLLRRLLYLDILAMPRYMLIGLESLSFAADHQSSSTSFLEYLSADELSKVSSESNTVSSRSYSSSSSMKPLAMKLSSLRPDLRLRGITSSGGSSFAKWFDVIPPNIQVDDDFTCDKSTKLKRDRFLRTEELDKYLSVSEFV